VRGLRYQQHQCAAEYTLDAGVGLAIHGRIRTGDCEGTGQHGHVRIGRCVGAGCGSTNVQGVSYTFVQDAQDTSLVMSRHLNIDAAQTGLHWFR